MANLAIKGHSTRGKEVIEILEMLGGKISHECGYKDGFDPHYVYFIDTDENFFIDGFLLGDEYSTDFSIFTLEEFLEKYPYKIKDRVKIPNCDVACRVTNMIWNGVEIEYETTNSEENETFFADELQPYEKETIGIGVTKEFKQNYCRNCGSQRCSRDGEWLEECEYYKNEQRTLEEIKIDIPKGYEFAGVDDNAQQVVFAKIQPEYPKTYEECCKLLDICPNGSIVYAGNWVYGGDYLEKQLEKIKNFQKLLICRNAYWKIAGEQLDLGKPWEPDFTNNDEERYGIYTLANKVEKDFCGVGDVNTILVFPTEEMRDAFSDSEEIAQLIENCKEFL